MYIYRYIYAFCLAFCKNGVFSGIINKYKQLIFAVKELFVLLIIHTVGA